MSQPVSGYNDRINHAFAFAAKYRGPRMPAEGGMTFLAHPANVAVILARHDADEVTLVAGIVHHVLEVTQPLDLAGIERKIDEKFGPAVLAIARDAMEPLLDERGVPLDWTHRKRILLSHLHLMDPRALDICCADEIHHCGTSIAVLERLGPEYLTPHGFPSGPLALCWYDDLLESLARRTDWPAHGMLLELRTLRDRFARATGGAG
jgi:(p)ppGpp synthase/HD superfamily hydrolase